MTQTADEVILGAWSDTLARPSNDPRAIWHGTGPQAGRPEQRLPALDGTWRVFFLRGGRGSGKTRAGAQGLAGIILADTDSEGEYGIIAPTYADAWTKCVEGESGILKALGTSMAEVKDHKSKLVRSAWRTYGQVVMQSGLIIYIDSADEGGLRIQGRNLKAAWCISGHEPVICKDATKPIRDVKPGDEVLTRSGWREVLAARCTGQDRATVEIVTADGRTLQCTPDHRVWTGERGWVQACNLRLGDHLSLVRQPGTTGTKSAGTERTAGTTSMTTAPGNGCTSRSGRSTTARSREAGSSTTRTTTAATTSQATSKPSPGPGTTGTISRALSAMLRPGPGSGPGSRSPGHTGRPGCSYASTAASHLRRGVPGLLFATALNAVKPGRASKAKRVSADGYQNLPVVKTAEGNSLQKTGEPAIALLSAQVVEVRPSRPADVYDLTVDEAHEFYANGILVKNCDEIGLWQKWEVAWGESLKYAVRMGVSVIIATGTPKVSQPARKLVRSLIRDDPEHGGVVTRRLRTIDNIANLSEAFYRTVIGSAKGTRLERQELEGELLEDVANALWTRELVEDSQCPWVGEPGGPEFLTRVWIGVDPSDGKEESDEQAYTVVARGRVDDPHLYVLESWGAQEPPVMFAKRVIKLAQSYIEGGAPAMLVVEKNHGSEWLVALFNQVMKETGAVPFETVTASKAKRTRAEPVSGLYERGIVRHCQRRVTYQLTDPQTGEVTWHTDVERFSDLEDQMCSFTGAAGERSPDRLDSLVWACHLSLDAWYGPPVAAGKREWAGGDDLDAGTDVHSHLPEVLAEPARRRPGGSYDNRKEWDEADWAPQTDQAQEQPTGGAAQVKRWR